MGLPTSRELQRVARLRAADWATLAAARWWLALAAAGLRFLGLERTRALVAPHRAGPQRRLDREELEHVAMLVRGAARIALRRHRCLPRSLVLCRLLAARGAEPQLQIGVRRRADAMTGHAWVEVDGLPVGEAAPPSRRFEVLRR